MHVLRTLVIARAPWLQRPAGTAMTRTLVFLCMLAASIPAAAKAQASADPGSAAQQAEQPAQQATASDSSQENSPHVSRWLSNSYVGLQVGYISYGFSSAQVQPGFQAQSVRIPHFGARSFVFGHEFNKYLSAEISE